MPSVPMQTLTPASSIFAMGANPLPSFMFDAGFAATKAPRSRTKWRCRRPRPRDVEGGDDGNIEHAYALEVLNGRHAVMTLLALLVLAFRLGDMNVNGQARLLRNGGEVRASLLVGGVLGVDVVVDANTPVERPMILLDQTLHLRAMVTFGKRLRLEEQLALADVHFHARLVDRANALVGVIVHVRETHHAVARHLRAGEKRRPIIVLGGHLRFEGPHRIVQPRLERKIFRVATRKASSARGRGRCTTRA